MNDCVIRLPARFHLLQKNPAAWILYGLFLYEKGSCEEKD